MRDYPHRFMFRSFVSEELVHHYCSLLSLNDIELCAFLLLYGSHRGDLIARHQRRQPLARAWSCESRSLSTLLSSRLKPALNF
eukprot:m.303346 g.303346  ORF g.303346 m.303346 type:complete len:83 (-) comp55247_c0_seq8:323-571(-)